MVVKIKPFIEINMKDQIIKTKIFRGIGLRKSMQCHLSQSCFLLKKYEGINNFPSTHNQTNTHTHTKIHTHIHTIQTHKHKH